MFSGLVLQNFKCFRGQFLQLKPVTLLTGLNGMGKSTVLQAILLIRQSMLQGMLPGKGLLLNGPLVRLGTAGDILYRDAENDEIGISFIKDGENLEWRFNYMSQFDDVLKVMSEPATTPPESVLTGEAHYLSAERIGPRLLYEVSPFEVEQRHDIGSDGRFGVAYLDWKASSQAHPSLVHEHASDASVRAQVIAWLGEITPGVQLTTRPYPELSRVTVGVGFEADRVKTRLFSPPNVGFGLSYILPVVVAIIASPPGTTIMIENPEAHLHPKGQTAMGRLIARGARAGLFLLVETHSDHLMNGVRLAVKQGEIDPGLVSVHFFWRRAKAGQFDHFVDSPCLDPDGRFDRWPEGFFDEWEKTLDGLID